MSNSEAREQMFTIMHEIIDGEHDLCEAMREGIKATMAVAEAMDVDLPEHYEEEMYVALICANIAIGAANIASHTEGMQESGEATEMILGMWAGMLMQARMVENDENIVKHLLGMGDN